MVDDKAIIDPGASVGANTQIWQFVHVCEGAEIGDYCSLGQGVFVGKKVRIGSGCRIQNHVSIFEGVTLEQDVFCGPHTTFTNIRRPRAFVSQKEKFVSTLVRRGVTIGANVTVICGIEIGEYALIGAGTVLTSDVKAFSLVVGNPSRQIGWVDELVNNLPFPYPHREVDTLNCTVNGQRYVLSDNQVFIEKN